jgi:hypothetical protein
MFADSEFRKSAPIRAIRVIPRQRISSARPATLSPRSKAPALERTCLRSSASPTCDPSCAAATGKLELPGQVRSQAGAWERGNHRRRTRTPSVSERASVWRSGTSCDTPAARLGAQLRLRQYGSSQADAGLATRDPADLEVCATRAPPSGSAHLESELEWDVRRWLFDVPCSMFPLSAGLLIS